MATKGARGNFFIWGCSVWGWGYTGKEIFKKKFNKKLKKIFFFFEKIFGIFFWRRGRVSGWEYIGEEIFLEKKLLKKIKGNFLLKHCTRTWTVPWASPRRLIWSLICITWRNLLRPYALTYAFLKRYSCMQSIEIRRGVLAIGVAAPTALRTVRNQTCYWAMDLLIFTERIY